MEIALKRELAGSMFKLAREALRDVAKSTAGSAPEEVAAHWLAAESKLANAEHAIRGTVFTTPELFTAHGLAQAESAATALADIRATLVGVREGTAPTSFELVAQTQLDTSRSSLRYLRLRRSETLIRAGEGMAAPEWSRPMRSAPVARAPKLAAPLVEAPVVSPLAPPPLRANWAPPAVPTAEMSAAPESVVPAAGAGFAPPEASTLAPGPRPQPAPWAAPWPAPAPAAAPTPTLAPAPVFASPLPRNSWVAPALSAATAQVEIVPAVERRGAFGRAMDFVLRRNTPDAHAGAASVAAAPHAPAPAPTASSPVIAELDAALASVGIHADDVAESTLPAADELVWADDAADAVIEVAPIELTTIGRLAVEGASTKAHLDIEALNTSLSSGGPALLADARNVGVGAEHVELTRLRGEGARRAELLAGHHGRPDLSAHGRSLSSAYQELFAVTLPNHANVTNPERVAAVVALDRALAARTSEILDLGVATA